MEQQRTHKKARLDEAGDERRRRQRRRREAIRQIKNRTVDFGGLPEELRGDAAIALTAIKRDWLNWTYVSARLWKNREFVLAALKVNGRFWEFASEELRGDPAFIVEAVRQSHISLQFLSEELRGVRQIVLEAVQQDGYELRNASEELRANREIVLKAVQQNGGALRFASEELRADREVVLEAVRKSGGALRFVSEDLRGDRVVVLAAVRETCWAVRYASEELLGDREIVLTALENTNLEPSVVERILRRVPKDLRNDPMVAGMMIRKGVCLPRGSGLVKRLENVLVAIRELPRDFAQRTVDEESVVEFSRRWEHSVWHKIWVVLQLEPPGMEGTGQVFVRLSGLPLELRHTRELRHLAPVIGAALSSFPDRDWKNLDSYLARTRR